MRIKEYQEVLKRHLLFRIKMKFNLGKKILCGVRRRRFYKSPLFFKVISGCVFAILCGIIKIILEVLYECFL